MILGSPVVKEPHNPLRQAPGGSATVVLGGDPTDPHDTFCATSSEKFANIRSTTRLHHAPGGASTICFGDDSVSSTPVRKPSGSQKTPDPRKAVIQSAPTPSRFRQSPGGETTICFGGDADDPFNTHGVSSSKFANGANQNCGNTITDRSTTRLHQAPGGASTLCLGHDDVDSLAAMTLKEPIQKSAVACSPDAMVMASPPVVATTSSNKFASGANQNSGNSITDRPTTRVHQVPGGASSICFGSD